MSLRALESAKRVFLLVPFITDSRRQIREKLKSYNEVKSRIGAANGALRAVGGVGRIFEGLGIARRTRFGTILDITNLPPLPSGSPVGQFLHIVFKLYQAVDPTENRKAHLESLKLVQQLTNLGHEVRIHDLGDARHRVFIRAAVRAGAKKHLADAEDVREHSQMRTVLEGVFAGLTWARDRHVRIEGRLEKPISVLASMASGKEHFFGEGGSIVQVGPKEWVVAKVVLQDPRIETYKEKGHQFYAMPDGIQYDKTLSDLLDASIYNSTPHIDFNIGGIPEKRIVAVCPRYLSEHRLSVQLMAEKLGVKIVEVPKEEADRHPASFLPLGNGRVLVDSGAPKFIERLREAGVDVVPTMVPLDSLLVNKGGLHCLFNEL